MPREWRAVRPAKHAARMLRRSPTPQEQRLWLALRYKRVDGLRFRRQHPVGRFVVDFICVEKRLVWR